MSAVDDDVAADAIVAGPIVTAASDGGCALSAGGLDYATVDDDSSADTVVLAAANSCCIFSACNFDVATIDDECPHFVSSDAGFLICSSCDDEFTWSFDGESVAFFELYAVAANECGAFSQDELGVALDVEGLPGTVNIFCYDVCPVKQFEVAGSPVNPPVIDDSGVCDGEW